MWMSLGFKVSWVGKKQNQKTLARLKQGDRSTKILRISFSLSNCLYSELPRNSLFAAGSIGKL